MKQRLLSTILCLLLCFTFIVSCEKEEKSSSSSSEEVSTSSVSSSPSEEEQGNEESSSKKDSQTEPTNPLPITPNPETGYTYYRLWAKSSLIVQRDYAKWIFNDYESYINEMPSLTANRIDCITKEMFVDNFVVVVWRRCDYRQAENCSYHSLSWDGYEGEYTLTLEYTSVDREYEAREVPFPLDVILIPRSEVGGADISDCVMNLQEVNRLFTTENSHAD